MWIKNFYLELSKIYLNFLNNMDFKNFRLKWDITTIEYNVHSSIKFLESPFCSHSSDLQLI